ncbi:hypothetical protein FF38_05418 [Lucilia cuprina]|uniref:Uncharacterized protein n=1 Tax=Lucilia cuprina TaxID=7375 RepID=A0A0L0BXC3_LUCCU|nr:hypothetical protein FF38_05418 [Lucilia cuprina]
MKFCILIFLIVAILAALIPIAPANPILENVETIKHVHPLEEDVIIQNNAVAKDALHMQPNVLVELLLSKRK